MVKITRNTKQQTRALGEVIGGERLHRLQFDVLEAGKAAPDDIVGVMGRSLFEAVLLTEREELAGSDYRPSSPDLVKSGSQAGSFCLGGTKTSVLRLRLRGPKGGIELETYAKMKKKDGFSKALFGESLRGLAGRRYQETVEQAAQNFGVSKSSVSRHIVDATVAQLREFQERPLSDFFFLSFLKYYLSGLKSVYRRHLG